MALRWPAYAVLFALGLLLRLAWVLAVDREGFTWNDPLQYHVSALSVVNGLGFAPLDGGPSARWPPGYTVLLAGTYSVFGKHPLGGEIVNAVIGALTIVVLMLAVERAIDRKTAVVAGAMLAVLPGPIMWTDLLVSETLFTALFVAFFLVIVYAEPTWGWMLLIGAMIGVGAMVRGEALTWGLLPIVAFWPSLPRVDLAKRIGTAALAAIVVLMPWTIRNAVVMDAFIPVATNASQTLWAGHNPAATGGQVYPAPEYFEQFSPEPRDRELESSAAMRDEALEYMVTHPIRELELIPLKLVHLNRGDSYALDWVNDVPEGEALPISPIDAERIGVVADAAYYSLLAMTLLGALLLGRSFWATRLGRCIATSFITALVLYGFVYYGNYRYRLPYEPLMVVVAATLVTRLWRSRNTISTADPAEYSSEPTPI